MTGLSGLSGPSGLIGGRGVPYAASVLADGPVGYWRVAETSGTNAADASGHGQAGTYVGAVAFGKPGALVGDPDTAVGLDGVSAEIQVPVAVWPDGLALLTVEMWVKARSYPASADTRLWSTAGNLNWLRLRPDGKLEASLRQQPGVSAGPVGTKALPLGAWRHVAVTYRWVSGATPASTARLYVDGVLESELTGPNGPLMVVTGSGRHRIGAMPGTPDSRFLDGDVDEVAFYHACLDPTRIAAHRAAGA